MVLDKWFRVQAMADLPDAVERVEALLQHPAFTFKRPDRLRAVLGAFAANAKHFHRRDGRGYKLMADAVLQVRRRRSFFFAAAAVRVGWIGVV